MTSIVSRIRRARRRRWSRDSLDRITDRLGGVNGPYADGLRPRTATFAGMPHQLSRSGTVPW